MCNFILRRCRVLNCLRFGYSLLWRRQVYNKTRREQTCEKWIDRTGLQDYRCTAAFNICRLPLAQRADLTAHYPFI